MLNYMKKNNDHSQFLKNVRIPSVKTLLNESHQAANLIAVAKKGWISNLSIAFLPLPKDTQKLDQIKVLDKFATPYSPTTIASITKNMTSWFAHLPKQHQPATCIATGFCDDEPRMILESKDCCVLISAKYHKIITSRYTQAIPHIYNHKEMVLYTLNKQIVGIFMPIKTDDDNNSPLNSPEVIFID